MSTNGKNRAELPYGIPVRISGCFRTQISQHGHKGFSVRYNQVGLVEPRFANIADWFVLPNGEVTHSKATVFFLNTSPAHVAVVAVSDLDGADKCGFQIDYPNATGSYAQQPISTVPIDLVPNKAPVAHFESEFVLAGADRVWTIADLVSDDNIGSVTFSRVTVNHGSVVISADKKTITYTAPTEAESSTQAGHTLLQYYVADADMVESEVAAITISTPVSADVQPIVAHNLLTSVVANTDLVINISEVAEGKAGANIIFNTVSSLDCKFTLSADKKTITTTSNSMTNRGNLSFSAKDVDTGAISNDASIIVDVVFATNDATKQAPIAVSKFIGSYKAHTEFSIKVEDVAYTQTDNNADLVFNSYSITNSPDQPYLSSDRKTMHFTSLTLGQEDIRFTVVDTSSTDASGKQDVSSEAILSFLTIAPNLSVTFNAINRIASTDIILESYNTTAIDIKTYVVSDVTTNITASIDPRYGSVTTTNGLLVFTPNNSENAATALRGLTTVPVTVTVTDGYSTKTIAVKYKAAYSTVKATDATLDRAAPYELSSVLPNGESGVQVLVFNKSTGYALIDETNTSNLGTHLANITLSTAINYDTNVTLYSVGTTTAIAQDVLVIKPVYKAIADAYSANWMETKTMSVLADNDQNITGIALTSVLIVTGNGTVTNDGTSITYTPTAADDGIDVVLRYTAGGANTQGATSITSATISYGRPTYYSEAQTENVGDVLAMDTVGNFFVDYGDGNIVQTTTINQASVGTGLVKIWSNDASKVQHNDVFTTIHVEKCDNIIDASNMFNGCSKMTAFTVGSTAFKNTTNFSYAWFTCSGLLSFPLVDTSSGTDFSYAWYRCTSIASFSAIDTSKGTDFNRAWCVCSSLTSFPLLDTSSGIDFQYAWFTCSSLTSFPAVDTSNGTNFYYTWGYCSGLTSFPLLNTSKGTDFSYSWGHCSSLTSFPLLDTSKGIDFQYAWYDCSSLISFPLVDTSNGTSFYYTWGQCSSLTSLPLLNTSKGIDFHYAWYNCTSLTSFPAIDTSSGTDFSYSWYNCTGLTSFPLLNASNVTDFHYAWYNCSSLLSFPLLNTSKGTDFQYAWFSCAKLLCLTNVDTTSATITTGMLDSCPALINPTAAERNAIVNVGTGGMNYVNANPCT